MDKSIWLHVVRCWRSKKTFLTSLCGWVASALHWQDNNCTVQLWLVHVVCVSSRLQSVCENASIQDSWHRGTNNAHDSGKTKLFRKVADCGNVTQSPCGHHKDTFDLRATSGLTMVFCLCCSSIIETWLTGGMPTTTDWSDQKGGETG